MNESSYFEVVGQSTISPEEDAQCNDDDGTFTLRGK